MIRYKTRDKRFQTIDETVSTYNSISLSSLIRSFVIHQGCEQGSEPEGWKRILRIVVMCVLYYIRYSRRQSRSVVTSRRRILSLASNWRNVRFETHSGRNWAGGPFRISESSRRCHSISLPYKACLRTNTLHETKPNEPNTTKRRAILRATNPRRVLATPTHGVHGRCPESRSYHQMAP